MTESATAASNPCEVLLALFKKKPKDVAVAVDTTEVGTTTEPEAAAAPVAPSEEIVAATLESEPVPSPKLAAETEAEVEPATDSATEPATEPATEAEPATEPATEPTAELEAEPEPTPEDAIDTAIESAIEAAIEAAPAAAAEFKLKEELKPRRSMLHAIFSSMSEQAGGGGAGRGGAGRGGAGRGEPVEEVPRAEEEPAPEGRSRG